MVGSNVAFFYWGRRGFSRFVLEAARAADSIEGLNAYFSVSSNNEIFPEFAELGDNVLPVATFGSAAGALLKAPLIVEMRRRIVNWLVDRDVKCAAVLMPHVWTPLIADAIKERGIHYAVVMHDARPHPGDPTGLIFKWLLNDAKAADTVITLSPWVREQLIEQRIAPAGRIKTVFMPDVCYPSEWSDLKTARIRRSETSRPLRILFFGRLLPYKGISLFADAMEKVAESGVPFEVSVCGEGDLGGQADRLAKLGATIINRWLSDDEVGQLLVNHDVAVLTHVEASQSGTVAAAMGAALPVVATPVGGLAHQVQSRGGGLVAKRVNADCIADCIRTLALDSRVYNAILDQIASYNLFSMANFLQQIVNAIPPAKGPTISERSSDYSYAHEYGGMERARAYP